MSHRGFRRRVPQVTSDAASRDGLECRGGHKLACGCGHHDLNFSAALAQPPDEVRTLIGGDAASDAEKDAFALHGMSPLTWIIAPRPPKRCNRRCNRDLTPLDSDLRSLERLAM